MAKHPYAKQIRKKGRRSPGSQQQKRRQSPRHQPPGHRHPPPRPKPRRLQRLHSCCSRSRSCHPFRARRKSGGSVFRVHPSITDVRNPPTAGITTEEGEARAQKPDVHANPRVERTQKRGERDRFAPAPPACYEAVVELEEPLVEEPDEELPVDPAETLDDEELPAPAEPLFDEPLDELPESFALPLPEPPVCEPDVPPEPVEPPVVEPVELPVPLALPDSVPLVDDPLVLPDPEAELSDDAVPS